jgi:hypothetical protein
MSYRINRNIEASIIDQIIELLEDDGWTGIRVEKSFSEVYKGALPCICVNSIEIRPVKKEIGSKLHIKYFTINIRIFGTSDGNRLDLSDWLFDKLENDLNYYTYNITNGEVSEKNISGRIIITKWFENKKELTNTENLSKEDRYRHLLSFECYIA